MSSYLCRIYFRFTKQQIYTLIAQLKITKEVCKELGVRSSPLQAFLCLLARLAAPCRPANINILLGIDIDGIRNDAIKLSKYLFRQFGYLSKVGHYSVSKQRIQDVLKVSRDSQPYIRTLYGFVDETLLLTGVPKNNPTVNYEKSTGLKYQVLADMKGFVLSLEGPASGNTLVLPGVQNC
ncbi:hypothetical protein DASC09_062760 [Saccharomycopsis crataegensis]|uniref:Homing endonuclease LAGLIDADG domain-containing protein n=1 Tax=Saccharomycopsis crataegensis TaxID=43959 RepID=A0AAV5QVL2_9ASCO|nr:hypothetical protein DASC09_062760 [Saccharomycopsis crataegensis]